MKSSDPVGAASLRKRYNRVHSAIVGDLVRVEGGPNDGEMGVFRGISAHSIDDLTIQLYRAPDGADEASAKSMPGAYQGAHITVSYAERPTITPSQSVRRHEPDLHPY